MNFSLLQNNILSYWEKEKTFSKSNEGKSIHYSFYDGPPFATGEPHYGHLLSGTIKDVVCRYHSMNGKLVNRRFGWDCHGLPLENQAQKFFSFTSFKKFAQDHNNVVAFNGKCVELINNCQTSWEETSNLLGRWIEFDNCYRTMDLPYMESVWWVFQQIYNQGRIKQESRIMPYSPRLQTSLSNSESSHYREVTDHGLYVAFKVADYDVLVYTTTPWTLPMNSGLCVNTSLTYSLVNGKYVVATNLVASLFDTTESCVDFNVNQLVGQEYKTLFSYFATQGKVVADSFVSDTEGTGVVHMAPAYGEDDYRVAKANGLGVYEGLDDECKFLPLVTELEGRFCQEGNVWVLKQVEEATFKVVNITHDYPYCERTGMPLIYRLQSGWILQLSDVKDRLVKNNADINWVPDNIGKNRFHNWLMEAKDWNISRQRLWGTPLPLWVAEDGDVLCVGSLAELNALHSGEPVVNLHKEYVDHLVLVKDGKEYRRVPEVLDCWFESGCMPYGQLHYPFENQELFQQTFPADFIAEGLDQTRGWFYSLLVIGTLLFDKAPFKNVIVNGLILAEDGQKMSKSKKNYPNPSVVLSKYGSDAVRAYLCSGNSVQAMPTRFSEEQVGNVNKNLIVPLLSTLNFYSLHVGNPKTSQGLNELDKWILSKFNELNQLFVDSFSKYELFHLVPTLISFMDHMNNWYIRYSRKNLYNNTDSFGVFTDVLVKLSKLMAPLLPFVSEHLYQTVTNSTDSVHLQPYPMVEELPESNCNMEKVQKLTYMLNSYKTSHNLSLNNEVSEVHLFRCQLTEQELLLFKSLNHVQQVHFLAGDSVKEYVDIQYAPNYKVLGKRLGQHMKATAEAIKTLHGPLTYPVVCNSILLSEEELLVKYNPINPQSAFYHEAWADILIN